MALPASGQISVSDILAELELDIERADTSLEILEQGDAATINIYSSDRPDGIPPYSLSEWYSYNHTAAAPAPYYWDLSNDIKWDSATDKPLQSTTEDFSMSLWVRPQWAATDLNLVIFDLTPSGTTTTANRFYLQYDYGLNRFLARYRSSATNFSRQWALHDNNTATGTGASSSNTWTGANRGNVNSDGFVHLFLTYDASQSTGAAAFKLYWNNVELTTTATSDSGTRYNMTLDELTFCGNDHNTAGSRIADYMFMHMWDQLPTSGNRSAMYNSGDPTSAADASFTTNLLFGDTSTSAPSVNDADDSGNYDFAAANGQSLVQL